MYNSIDTSQRRVLNQWKTNVWPLTFDPSPWPCRLEPAVPAGGHWRRGCPVWRWSVSSARPGTHTLSTPHWTSPPQTPPQWLGAPGVGGTGRSQTTTMYTSVIGASGHDYTHTKVWFEYIMMTHECITMRHECMMVRHECIMVRHECITLNFGMKHTPDEGLIAWLVDL